MTPWKEALENVAKAITDSYSAGEFGTILSAERVIESLSQAGYAVVPREPTPRMVLDALASAVEEDGGVGYYPARFHTAMIQAWEKERDAK